MQHLDIACEREARRQPAKAVGGEEARGQHDQDRRHEERYKNQHERRHVEPAGEICAWWGLSWTKTWLHVGKRLEVGHLAPSHRRAGASFTSGKAGFRPP